MSTTNKLLFNSLWVATCGLLLCLAISVAQGQYDNFDSDSSSDSDGDRIYTNAELGKLVRNSAKHNSHQHNNHQLSGQRAGQQHQQQATGATRNLYNRQQALQYAPTQQTNRRHQFAAGAHSTDGSELGGYGPVMGASHGRPSSANSDADEDEAEGAASGPFGGANFGANFDGNDNDGEGANTDAGQPMNLNQAASGYPGQGAHYGNSDALGAGFNFGASGAEGADFGPSGDGGFGGGGAGASYEGRRAKSASSLAGARGFGLDDDAGAPQFGPNSAVNAGDADDEGRPGYAPDAASNADNDNDDE